MGQFYWDIIQWQTITCSSAHKIHIARGRQDQGRKGETMSLISFSSLIIVTSSVELPYLSTATNWRLHANDKEMSGEESVSVGQTVFF